MREMFCDQTLQLLAKAVRAIEIEQKMRRVSFKMIALAGAQGASFYVPPFFIYQVQIGPETIQGTLE